MIYIDKTGKLDIKQMTDEELLSEIIAVEEDKNQLRFEIAVTLWVTGDDWANLTLVPEYVAACEAGMSLLIAALGRNLL